MTDTTADIPVINPAVSPETITERVVWSDLFGNDHPVEIDIGCGKGMFLIESAQADPAVNWFGIETMGKPYHIARERIAKRRLPNVRLIKTDARAFVAEKIADRTVSAYHILFPDPWPKKRHHKRRVVTPGFVAALARTLVENGRLRIATDIADYFDELMLTVEEGGLFSLRDEGDFHPERDAPTNFARKYLRQGRDMYRGEFVLNG